MIKNRRQYDLTKKQLENFYSSLEEVKKNPPTNEALDPLFSGIYADAIQGQICELESEVAEYEALLHGDIKVFECSSLAELPLLLIKARISMGLSQKELAEKLGLKEQQIQRYEATDYESASLSRLLEISNALGLKFTQKVELPGDVTLSDLLAKASKVGLTQDFILKKLIPIDIKAKIKAEIADIEESFSVSRIADMLSRVFKWQPSDIFGGGSLSIQSELAPSFKMPKKRDADFAKAYTIYAHYLSLVTVEFVSDIPVQKVPDDPLCVKKEVASQESGLTLRNLLNFIWDLGIPVLPLNDPGAFHGACWRINGRNVIVVKQKSPYETRWIFDLAHELYHASQVPSDMSRSVVDIFDDFPDYSESQEEISASDYAGKLTLGPFAEKYANECIDEARGKLELMRGAVIKVAEKYKIDVGFLANYLAFRLSIQGVNWWGTANNLQCANTNPWIIARDIFLERVDLSKVNKIDRELILLAMTSEEA
jgi:transcriptional regulator with XRE-family HTH domain/Zn-dependent peptidase ImmA (M78 family)